jgi:hypothetical protein
MGFSRIRRAIMMTALCAASAGSVAAAYPHAPIAPSSCGWTVASMPQAISAASFNGSSGTSASDIWAVGSQASFASTLIEHFDGSQWAIVSSPNAGSRINVLEAASALGPTDAWAVGQQLSGSQPQTLTEHWDGRVWSVVASIDPSPGDLLQGVAMISHGDVWAVGTQCGNGCRPLIEHFNGAHWFAHYAPSSGAFPELWGASADAPNDVWAVGDTETRSAHGAMRNVALAERWDGSAWRLFPTENPNERNRFLTVKAFSQTDAWAAGFTATNTTFGHVLIEHWDGVRWSVIPNPAQSGQSSLIYSLSGSGPNDLWAVGQQNTSASLLTLHWDGASWSRVRVAQPHDGTSSFVSAADLGPNDAWAFGRDASLAEHYCNI